MTYYDTDLTQTDWSEFEHQDLHDRRLITHSEAAPGNPPGANPDTAMICRQAKGLKASQLEAMFDKFLYRR